MRLPNSGQPGESAGTSDQIKNYLLGEGVAIQKVPERLEVVEAMSTTATGKFQKHLLGADIKDKLQA